MSQNHVKKKETASIYTNHTWSELKTICLMQIPIAFDAISEINYNLVSN